MLKIYGFGNALVDIEVSITENELSILGINKSSMIHVSSKQKSEWLNPVSYTHLRAHET